MLCVPLYVQWERKEAEGERERKVEGRQLKISNEVPGAPVDKEKWKLNGIKLIKNLYYKLGYSVSPALANFSLDTFN